jgi:hypothetical protein
MASEKAAFLDAQVEQKIWSLVLTVVQDWHIHSF